MKTNILYVLIMVVACFLSSCATAATPSPTYTQVIVPSSTPMPTSTSTALPTSTATPIPTSTSTSTPLPTQTSTPTLTSTPAPLPSMVEHIHWLGSAGFRIEGELVIYIDPTMLDGDAPLADVVLITHGHNDHLKKNILRKILHEDTVFIVGPGVAPLLTDFDNVEMLPPGSTITVGDIVIESWPAYYEEYFHPKSENGVGFLITIGGEKIYISGDTTNIPEIADLRCDIAILWLPLDDPVGPEGPAEIARQSGAAVVIPHVYLTTSTGDADYLRAIYAFQRAYDGMLLKLEREK